MGSPEKKRLFKAAVLVEASDFKSGGPPRRTFSVGGSELSLNFVFALSAGTQTSAKARRFLTDPSCRTAWKAVLPRLPPQQPQHRRSLGTPGSRGLPPKIRRRLGIKVVTSELHHSRFTQMRRRLRLCGFDRGFDATKSPVSFVV